MGTGLNSNHEITIYKLSQKNVQILMKARANLRARGRQNSKFVINFLTNLPIFIRFTTDVLLLR